jgi:hypothetical protein
MLINGRNPSIEQQRKAKVQPHLLQYKKVEEGAAYLSAKIAAE